MQQNTSTTIAAPSRRATIHNGSFSISHFQRGIFTVKVGTPSTGSHVGNRLIYLLVGPDPLRDYSAVATLHDGGGPATIEQDSTSATPWEKYVGPRSVQPLDAWHYQIPPGWSVFEQKTAIFLDLAVRLLAAQRFGWQVSSHHAANGYKVEVSSRCVRCNKPLEDSASLLTGYCQEES